MEAKLVCGRCRKEIQGDMKYCPYCGVPTVNRTVRQKIKVIKEKRSSAVCLSLQF